MVLAVGTFYNHFIAPHEVAGDSPEPPHDRIKHYRSCAGWALIWGKYTQPSAATLPAFVLYVEANFLFNRYSQMNCYVLSGVCIRLMLKMGLHRDPSKLANISAFEGEMRRRMWNMAIQIDLLVAFHMGLPSMLQGIETDTMIPRNLTDEDFDEHSENLPPARPDSDHTPLTYPIQKTKIIRVFGQIARQSHALTPPSYSEVLKLDEQLEATWRSVPSFMKPKSLEECVGDSSILLIQRFGLASLYYKCLCVLHRRYLAEAVPKSEHEHSRKQCLRAAVALLNHQYTIWDYGQPGHILSQQRWFITSLSVHDFTLAAMVIYLYLQNEHFSDGNGAPTTLSKAELRDMLKRAHMVWSDLAIEHTELSKTAGMLAVMLDKVGSPVVANPAVLGIGTTLSSGSNNDSPMGSSIAHKSSNGTHSSDGVPLSSLSLGQINTYC